MRQEGLEPEDASIDHDERRRNAGSESRASKSALRPGEPQEVEGKERPPEGEAREREVRREAAAAGGPGRAHEVVDG